MLKKNEEIEDVMKTESGRQRILEALIGEGVEEEGRPELREVVLGFCKQAMKRRNGLVLHYLDQRT